MARTTVSNVNFVGNGNDASFYFNPDEQAALNQPNAEALQEVNVEVLVAINGGFAAVPAGTRVTAKIAVDRHGHQLKNPNHLIVLPCPPYCNK